MVRGRERGWGSGSGVLAACVWTEMLSFSLSAKGVAFSGCAAGEQMAEWFGVFVGVFSSSQ